MILLDTDVCIEILRGNKKVLRKRGEHTEEVAISFMTVAELYFGAESSAYPKENRTLIEKFILATPVIHTDIAILKRFGEIKASLRRNNLLVPDADLYIAATCIEKANTLVTGNVRHFNRIDGLKIENWIR